MDAHTDRPYISSLGAGSQGAQGGGGSQLYMAALDWIHNNGKKIKDDPGGLSPINKIRRTSNLLASALRWKTTSHLSPHEKQNIGTWTRDDDINLQTLAIKEMENVHQAIPESRNWTFDFESGKFQDSHGTELTEDHLAKSIDSSDPGNSGIGLSTLQRALVTRSALQAIQRGSAAETVESLVSDLPGSLEEISYSLGPAERPKLTLRQLQETEDAAFDHAKKTRIVNTDDVRPLIPGYEEADPLTRDNAYHTDSSAIAKQVLRRMLAEPPVTGKVLVLAGGGGSGKSTAKGIFSPEADFTFDTTLSNPVSATTLANQIRESGRKMEVVYVHRNFAGAFENVIGRYLLGKLEGAPRIVPLQIAASAHIGAQETLFGLKGVPVIVIDNNGRREDMHIISLEKLESSRYTKSHETPGDSGRENAPVGNDVHSGASGKDSAGSGQAGRNQNRSEAQARLEAEGRAILESHREEGLLTEDEVKAFLGD